MKKNSCPIIPIFAKPLFLTLETLSLILLPLILIQFKPELIHYRKWLLIASFVYVFYIICAQKIGFRELGLTFKNFFPALRSILLPTFFVLAAMFLAIPVGWDSKYFFIKEMVDEITAKPLSLNYFYAIATSAPIQEIIFRGFYISRLEFISKNKLFIVAWSSIVFALVHTPFENKLFALFTLILGVIYADNFLKYRNIFAIIISHALLLCGVIIQAIY
jgi:hypothetical protein